MFTSACAFHFDGAFNQILVDTMCFMHLVWFLWVKQNKKVKVAVACVALSLEELIMYLNDLHYIQMHTTNGAWREEPFKSSLVKLMMSARRDIGTQTSTSS